MLTTTFVNNDVDRNHFHVDHVDYCILMTTMMLIKTLTMVMKRVLLRTMLMTMLTTILMMFDTYISYILHIIYFTCYIFYILYILDPIYFTYHILYILCILHISYFTYHMFLDASSHLYDRLCLFLGQFMGRSVGPWVGPQFVKTLDNQ